MKIMSTENLQLHQENDVYCILGQEDIMSYEDILELSFLLNSFLLNEKMRIEGE